MPAATLNGNPRASTISCHSPTNISEETDEPSSPVQSIPKHNVPVIGSDINAEIGKNGNHKYSLHWIEVVVPWYLQWVYVFRVDILRAVRIYIYIYI